MVTGGDPFELKGDGGFLDHDERYGVSDEFLSIWRKLMQREEVSETHDHSPIEKGKLLYPPRQKRHPPLYFGGSSEAGDSVAARRVDVNLTWGEPPAAVAQKIAAAKAAAAAQGRTFSYGVRLDVIVRETSAEARRAADELISRSATASQSSSFPSSRSRRRPAPTSAPPGTPGRSAQSSPTSWRLPG